MVFLFFGILLVGNPQILIGQIDKDDCTESCLNYPDCFDPTIPCETLVDKECTKGCPNYPCCLKEGLPCGNDPCQGDPDCHPAAAEWPGCVKESTPDPLTVVDKRGGQGVLRYEKYEVGFNLADRNFESPGQIGYVNPYDPNLISIEAKFTSPSGTVYDVNGFYYKPFLKNDQAPYWHPVQNLCPWRIRFAPNQIGDWEYSVKVVEEGVTTYESEVLTFECIVSDNPGPLRVSGNNRYLEFKNGDSFFAIAQDLRGEVNAGGKSVFPSDCPGPNPLNCPGWCFNPNTLKVHLSNIDDFKAYGGNMVRIWIEPHTYEFEWEYLGNYDSHQNRSFDLDELIEYCQAQDIYIHFVTKGVTNLERRDFSTQTGGWAENPYHTQAPLQLDIPLQFFAEDDAKEMYKRRLRYMVARWGYSTAIAAYSLMNEPEFYAKCEEPLFDCTGNKSYAETKPELFAWFKEMGQYLQDISFERKMLTIDFASTSPSDDVIADPIFDFTNAHVYTRDLNQNFQFAYENVWNREYWNKPTTMTESGGGSPWVSDRRETHLHHSIWSTALSGSYGTSFNYGSLTKFNHPCYGKGPRYYRPLSIFLEGETFNSEEHTFLPISNAQVSFDEFVQRDNPPWNYDPPSRPANSDLPDPLDRFGFAMQRYGECLAINEDYLTEDISTSDNERIQVFALRNPNRVLGWVHNKLYYWYNVVHGQSSSAFTNARSEPTNYPNQTSSSGCGWSFGVDVTNSIPNSGTSESNQVDQDVPSLEGETLTISNLQCTGFYQVEWYSTYPEYDINGDGSLEDGGIIDELTTVAFASDGNVTINIPKLTPTEWTTEAEPFAPSYGFKLIYIGGAPGNGSWQHDWPGGRDNDRLVGGDIRIQTPNDNNQVFYRNENGMIRHLFPSSYTNFIYGALNHWNQAPSHRIAEGSPIHLNSQDQVFYIGVDGRLQYYYWSPNGGAGQWTHAWVGGASANYSVSGDFAIDPATDDLFFRNENGHLHRFSLVNNNWIEDDLGLSNPTFNQRVAANSTIQINTWGQVFYQGQDNKLQYFRPTGNQWIHAWLSPNNNHTVLGSFVVHALGGNNQIFYRSTSGFIRHYRSVNNGNTWIHGALSSWSQPDKQKAAKGSPIRVNGWDQVFYKGKDGKMQYYFWTPTDSWQHDWPGGESNDYQVGGDIGINSVSSNHIFYRDGAGYLRHFSSPNGGTDWEYDDLTLNPAQTEIKVDNLSPIRVNTKDQAFYKGEDGKMQVYYWFNPCTNTGSGIQTEAPNDAIQYKAIPAEEEKPAAISKLDVFPNPASDQLTINWELPEAAQIDLYLTDVYGKRQNLVVSENAPAGLFTITTSTQNYANGFYLLYGVSNGELLVSRKVVIHH